MFEGTKIERQIIQNILERVNINSYKKEDQSKMMQALGLQNDVVFAKSLFCDLLAHKYQTHKGCYQTFMASDCVAILPYHLRKLFMEIVRLYHQQKIKKLRSKDNPLKNLSLPQSNNIQEITQFQKTMYQLFKHLISQKKETSEPQHENKFTPSNPFQTNRSFRHFDSDIFPQNASPYVPSFINPSFRSNNYSQYDKSQQNQGGKKDSFGDYSLFIKPKLVSSQQIDPFKSPVDPVFNYDPSRNQSFSQKGFSAFNQFQKSSKKIKKDYVTPRFSQIENMKNQLQQHNSSQKCCSNHSKQIKQERRNEIAEKDKAITVKKTKQEQLAVEHRSGE